MPWWLGEATIDDSASRAVGIDLPPPAICLGTGGNSSPSATQAGGGTVLRRPPLQRSRFHERDPRTPRPLPPATRGAHSPRGRRCWPPSSGSPPPSAAPPRRTGTSPAPRPSSGIEQLREHLPGFRQRQCPGRRPRPRRRGPARAADRAGPTSPPSTTSDACPRRGSPRTVDTALLTVVYDVPVTHSDIDAGHRAAGGGHGALPGRRPAGRARRRAAEHRRRNHRGARAS